MTGISSTCAHRAQWGIRRLDSLALGLGGSGCARLPAGRLWAGGQPAGLIEASLYYDVGMKKRPGGTVHLSISLPTAEANLLKKRAKRVHGGNVSRVVSDAIRYIAYEEGRDALIASFGKNAKPTSEDARRFDAEWGLSATKSA